MSHALHVTAIRETLILLSTCVGIVLLTNLTGAGVRVISSMDPKVIQADRWCNECCQKGGFWSTMRIVIWLRHVGLLLLRSVKVETRSIAIDALANGVSTNE